MKKTNYKILWMTAAGLFSGGMAVAQTDVQDLQAQLDRARAAMSQADATQLSAQMQTVVKAGQDAMKSATLADLAQQVDAVVKATPDAVKQITLDELKVQIDSMKGLTGGIALGIRGGVSGGIRGPLAFAPQTAADRAQEIRDRAREVRDRATDNEDRNIELYRAGTGSIDEHKYERAIDRFDRVIANKWSRADGAYYWKAYALNKLGKRDEALAALAEISKQFPQSRWINDAKALQVEIQQAAGKPVSPESQSDEDLKILAINSLVSSDPDRAVPLLEKQLNDPNASLSIKTRALFVLAQSRTDKSRDIVAQYAKSGSNPDLQLRAVQYLGTFRSKDSQQILADVYAANSDIAVKRGVLRSMMISRDTAHLLNAAKSEQNLELRREAIRLLGAVRATNELGQLYSTESNADLKETIIEGLFLARSDKLIDIAKNEKDPKLRSFAISRMGLLRENPAVGPALVEMYSSASDKDAKTQIIRSLWLSGSCKPLVDVIRNEKDNDLKSEGVQDLGRMKGCKEATDYLLELIAK